MNRKLIIGALAGGCVLALAGVIYRVLPLSGSGAGAQAVLTPAARPTVAGWAARVTAVAGSGVEGTTDGAAAQSRFSDPFGVAVDARGNVYVSDGGDSNRIRRIAASGTVTTFAGGHEGFADGAGPAAAFHTPSAVALDRNGNLYVADTGNHAIRKITPAGVVSTLAGNGKPGFADGSGAAAQFNSPVGLAVDHAGIVWVADTYNDRIRRIGPDGSVSTVAGTGIPGMADGPAVAAVFDTPSALVVGRDGALYVADTGNDAIRKIGTDGLVSTVAAPAEHEQAPLLRRPVGLALSHDGYLYIAAGAGGRILQLAPGGALLALPNADAAQETGFGNDGTVQLYGPRGVALERGGSLLVADALGLRVQRLAAPQPGVAAPMAAATPQPRRLEPMPWPVSPQYGVHEVVGLMGEVRGSYNGENRHHFHAGLDIRADVGARVLAVASSKVSDPFANWGFGTLSEGISVGPLSYIHMRVGRDPQGKGLDARFQLLPGPRGKPERVRVPRGTRFAVGDALGTVNSQAHVHLEYYPGGPLLNPLSLPFVGLSDSVAPRIQSVALYDGANRRLVARNGQRLRVARSLGEVNIVVDAYDQMDGNLARRRLGLYKLGYQLLGADGRPLPGFEQPLITQVYDRLPRPRDAVKLAYAPSSGITVHGSKVTQFAYAISNSLLGGQAVPGSWKVDQLAPGDYTLRIYAADYAGGVAADGRDLALTVE
ncbi:MAG TPA: NHL repeat-containing protein [Telluria sp.]